MWQERLVDAGVVVESVDADHVRLRTPDRTRLLRLMVCQRPLTPAQVRRLPRGEPGLLVLPRASKQVEQTALRHGWELVTADRVVLRDPADPTNTVDTGPDPTATTAPGTATPTRRRGPHPRGALTAIRCLVAAAPLTQLGLAALSGLSQPYLSKVLTNLRGDGLVQRTAGGWAPVDKRGLIDWWLHRYPGPGGATSYWASLAPLVDQAEAATADAAGPVAVSGDLAADLLAPWRRPRQVVVYAAQPPALTDRGFVPATSVEDASLVLTAPQDRGVWLPSPWPLGENQLLTADPLQVLYDIGRSGGPDAPDAAEHLTEALLGQLAATWREAVCR